MRRLSSFVLAAALALSCSSDPASFRVERAPGWSGGARSFSILGIYKDGRMSLESWDELGNRFSAPFSEPRCDAGFGDSLHSVDPDRYSRFEEDAMHEGMTDELIDGLAKNAQPDYVLVFHVFGRAGGLPRSTNPSVKRPPPPSASPMGGGMGRRGMGGMGGMGNRSMLPAGDESFGGGDPIPIEMAATIFSKAEHRSVAEISMKYTGKDPDEALNRFLQKLQIELAGAKCLGWTFTTASAAGAAK